MYEYSIQAGNRQIVIHTEVEECLKVFVLESYLKKEKLFDNCYNLPTCKTLHIYSYVRAGLMDRVDFERKKIVRPDYDVYISNKKTDPRGITILKKNNGYLCGCIIIDDNENSLLISLRCVLIKLFFDYHTALGCYPLHCSAVRKADKTYLFLADSQGGKSSVYFAFATCRKKGYTVLSDDTILCGRLDDRFYGHSMPLKPSLRVGTLQHLKQMEQYREKFSSDKFHIEDQIYIDVDTKEGAEVDLHGRIEGIFFINFFQTFSVKKIDDIAQIKKKLALSVCGYKATTVDQRLVEFLNMLVKDVAFYNVFVPSDMNAFISEFDRWEGQLIK